LASGLGIESPKQQEASLPPQSGADSAGVQEAPPEGGADSATAEEHPIPETPVAETTAQTPVAETPPETPVAETRGYATARPKVQRTADDWARLADVLGIEKPQEPPPPRPEQPEAAPPPELEKPAPLAEAWTESVIELMDGSPEAPVPAAGPAAESDFRGDRQRHKRHHRGRRPPEDQTAEAPPEGAPRDQFGAGLDIEPAEPAAEPVESAADAGEAAAVAGEEPRSPERSRRRRRRHGEKRRDREPDRPRPSEVEAQGAPVASEPERTAQQPDAEEEPDSFESDDELADEHDEDSEEAKGDKAGHRAIPNWQEAISYIIDKNMESRARRPDSGSSRPRGR